MAGGRPSEYTPEIVEKAREYLASCVDVQDDKTLKVKLPSIEWLAVYIWLAVSTVYLWENEHKEFSEVIDELRAKQADWLINNWLSWAYNPTIAKVLLTKHWYTDKIETENKNLNIETSPTELASMTDEQLQALLK